MKRRLAPIQYHTRSTKYFVIAAIKTGDGLQKGGGEYTFEEAGLYPIHYIQVTGVYDDKGITFWH